MRKQRHTMPFKFRQHFSALQASYRLEHRNAAAWFYSEISFPIVYLHTLHHAAAGSLLLWTWPGCMLWPNELLKDKAEDKLMKGTGLFPHQFSLLTKPQLHFIRVGSANHSLVHIYCKQKTWCGSSPSVGSRKGFQLLLHGGASWL